MQSWQKEKLGKNILNILGRMSIFLLFLVISTPQAMAQTVRVAFMPEMFGFYNYAENGTYSGYNYDFLMNVAQYTHWELEFVEIAEGSVSASLVKAEEMLKAGELDLVGPYSATSPNIGEFEIGEENYGIYRYSLYSARNNYTITTDNYFLKDRISIALVEYYADINEIFFDLVESRNLTYDVTYVQSQQEAFDMLLSEQVDTIINLDMSYNAQFLDPLTDVDRIPFYFASTKGNSALMAELDEAILRILVMEPDIHQTLLERYFGMRYEGDFIPTDEEKNQLDSHGDFVVGLVANMPPYQYVNDEGENVGITLDIMESLTEICGITFDIRYYPDENALVQAVATEEIDMVGSMVQNYAMAQILGVSVTTSYLNSGAYWLRNEKEVANPTILSHYISSEIPYYPQDEVTMVVDIQTAMDKMEKTGEISLFCDPNVAKYYIASMNLQNIQIQAVNDVRSDICFGVLDHVDEQLVGMLNRSILFLNESELDEIIFRHTTVQAEFSYYQLFLDFAVEIFLGFLLITTIVLWSVTGTSKKFKELSRRDGMTKLYNSGYFHQYAEEKAKKVSQGTLILIDIDFFKQVNDKHGHHVGDEVIKSVADKLTKHFRKEDMVARLGGDEFVIFLEYPCDSKELEERSALILKELAQENEELAVTLSIGGYHFRETMAYQELYQKADAVLYEVKENGRNAYLFKA